jgi:hypothetical protein
MRAALGFLVHFFPAVRTRNRRFVIVLGIDIVVVVVFPGVVIVAVEGHAKTFYD